MAKRRVRRVRERERHEIVLLAQKDEPQSVSDRT